MDKPPLVPRPQPSGDDDQKKYHEENKTYGRQHRKWRALVLARSPICQLCNKAFSTIAHHTEYPAKGPQSYMGICKPCHKETHKKG